VPPKPSRRQKGGHLIPPQIPPHLPPPRPSAPRSGGLALLRSPKVVVGGVLLFVLATACACGVMGDDDDCDSLGTTDPVFAAGSSGVRLAPPAQTQHAALPASGGFGTHLASCGG